MSNETKPQTEDDVEPLSPTEFAQAVESLSLVPFPATEGQNIWMAGAVLKLFATVRQLKDENAKWVRALGLLSVHMVEEVDINDPEKMARNIDKGIRRDLHRAEQERDQYKKQIVDFDSYAKKLEETCTELKLERDRLKESTETQFCVGCRLRYAAQYIHEDCCARCWEEACTGKDLEIVELKQERDGFEKSCFDLAKRATELGEAQERLRLQLAGCSCAAFGNFAEDPDEGDYGWSVAYKGVRELRVERDQLKEKCIEWQKLYVVACKERDRLKRGGDDG